MIMFTQIYMNVGTKGSYRTVGTGKLCAWHKRPKLSPNCLTNQLPFAVPENVGAFAPTGSVLGIGRRNIILLIEPHLKEGTGYAWAWHSSPNPWPLFRVIELLCKSDENVGSLAPTGSKEIASKDKEEMSL